MDFEQVVRERRSIRKFLDKPVEASALNAVLEDARLAPSWKNGQGWRLLVLTDREKILRAGAILGRNPGCDYATLPVLMFLLMDPRCSGQMDGQGLRPGGRGHLYRPFDAVRRRPRTGQLRAGLAET